MKTAKLVTKSLLVVLLLGTMQVHAEILVIVHKSNSLRSISEQDLKNIYLGKTRKFPNGKSATPLNLEYDGTREQFEAKILQKNKSALGRYWSKRVFTGKGKPPKEIGDEESMLNEVSNEENAIGYIKAGQATDKVKVIYRFR